MSAAEDKTTWGEVCQKVGFTDNLYRTCRSKLGAEFTPATPFGGRPEPLSGGDDDADDGDDADFNKQLKKSALPIPPPPPDDWEYKPQGLMDHLMYGDLPGKVIAYGGGALVLWLLWNRFSEAKTAIDKKPLTPVTSPK